MLGKWEGDNYTKAKGTQQRQGQQQEQGKTKNKKTDYMVILRPLKMRKQKARELEQPKYAQLRSGETGVQTQNC